MCSIADVGKGTLVSFLGLFCAATLERRGDDGAAHFARTAVCGRGALLQANQAPAVAPAAYRSVDALASDPSFVVTLFPNVAASAGAEYERDGESEHSADGLDVSHGGAA